MSMNSGDINMKKQTHKLTQINVQTEGRTTTYNHARIASLLHASLPDSRMRHKESVHVDRNIARRNIDACMLNIATNTYSNNNREN